LALEFIAILSGTGGWGDIIGTNTTKITSV